MNQRDLAKQLQPFRIKPRTVRIPQDGRSVTAKGYHPEQFADAWDRYLDQQPAEEAAKAPSDTEESAEGSDSAGDISGGR